MKKVDFNKLQAGDLVKVPRTQFAPMRSGWNGWLFSEAVVIRKGVGRKSKRNLLYEFEDGTKIYERIDAHALDGADMSDVIMQYDHEGRVFARQSNKTLILQPDYKGLKVAADLGKTDLARGLYQDIEAGMINKMSWAFSVAEESYDRETHTRTILKIKKVYDVSAVSIPANGDTEISARAFASRSYEQERQELLKRRAAILKIRASL